MPGMHEARDDALLLRRVRLLNAANVDGSIVDVLIEQGVVSRIGQAPAMPSVCTIDGKGGLLLPGLHDHHCHVAAMAAAFDSVQCGPPEIAGPEGLAICLTKPGQGWLRGIGYHESVAGMIDREWLDRAAPHRPVRIQHRSGRMWVFNSAGLDLLLAFGPPPPGLEQQGGNWTGRLFDEDAWLRQTLGSQPPGFAAVGNMLARFGVTGLTEMSPANDDSIATHFAEQHSEGALPQRIVLAGRLDLGCGGLPSALTLGAMKIHLHEEHLPPYEETVSAIVAAHAYGRAVAIHCVSEVELAFALASLRDAGIGEGDRIEHASVTSPQAIREIAALDLKIVVQPHFVAERGDGYRASIPETTWPDLYRLRSFLDAGITLAGGSDAPFGTSDPWSAMASAISRQTRSGALIGKGEAITPEEALNLYLADPVDLSRQRQVTAGMVADLCLLNGPWSILRERLSADCVRLTLIGGQIIHDGIDQPPGQSPFG